MKKIIVLFIAFIMLFTNIALANIDDVPIPKRLSGGSGDEIKNTVSMGEYAGIYKLLNYLEILNEEDGNIEDSSELERGYVAGIFSNIISPSKFSPST